MRKILRAIATAVALIGSLTAPAQAQREAILVPMDDLAASKRGDWQPLVQAMPGECDGQGKFWLNQHPINDVLGNMESGHGGGGLHGIGKCPAGDHGALVFGAELRAGLYGSKDTRHASGDRVRIHAGHQTVIDGLSFAFEGDWLKLEPAAARQDQRYAEFTGELSYLLLYGDYFDVAARVRAGRFVGLSEKFTRSIDYGEGGIEGRVKFGFIDPWLDRFSLDGFLRGVEKTALSTLDAKGRDPELTKRRVIMFTTQLTYHQNIFNVPTEWGLGIIDTLGHNRGLYTGGAARFKF